MSIENLERTYRLASEIDHKIALSAFKKYNTLVSAIAAKHGFTPAVGAAVFAALSPNNDYHGNLRDTDKLLSAAHQGLSLDDFSVCTYHPNKRKAWAIANGADPLQEIVALKTRNFYLNVSNPDDPLPVTIDGHMRNIWFNERKPLQAADWRRAVRVDAKLYTKIAEGVRYLAKDKGYAVANQMQGILWITWRKLHGIKTPMQLSFWDLDWQAANLGFVCS